LAILVSCRTNWKIVDRWFRDVGGCWRDLLPLRRPSVLWCSAPATRLAFIETTRRSTRTHTHMYRIHTHTHTALYICIRVFLRYGSSWAPPFFSDIVYTSMYNRKSCALQWAVFNGKAERKSRWCNGIHNTQQTGESTVDGQKPHRINGISIITVGRCCCYCCCRRNI
jgi:hypothetical protein